MVFERFINKKKPIIFTCLLLLIILNFMMFDIVQLRAYAKRAVYVYKERQMMAFNHGKFKGIPIIAYHCIDNNIFGDSDMFVSPQDFQNQMEYLYKEGFTPITFNQLDEVPKIRKPIIITMDDGYEDNYTNAYPILKKYKFRATIFLISNAIGHKRYLNNRQINQMRDLVDFESHTVNHRNLAQISKPSADFEIGESKQRLEKALHKRIFVLAYPYGAYNRDVIRTTKKYYEYGLTFETNRPDLDSREDSGYYAIRRMAINRNANLDAFKQLVGNYQSIPGLIVVNIYNMYHEIAKVI